MNLIVDNLIQQTGLTPYQIEFRVSVFELLLSLPNPVISRVDSEYIAQILDALVKGDDLANQTFIHLHNGSVLEKGGQGVLVELSQGIFLLSEVYLGALAFESRLKE